MTVTKAWTIFYFLSSCESVSQVFACDFFFVFFFFFINTPLLNLKKMHTLWCFLCVHNELSTIFKFTYKRWKQLKSSFLLARIFLMNTISYGLEIFSPYYKPFQPCRYRWVQCFKVIGIILKVSSIINYTFTITHCDQGKKLFTQNNNNKTATQMSNYMIKPAPRN